jgi:hypothetical protein
MALYPNTIFMSYIHDHMYPAYRIRARQPRPRGARASGSAPAGSKRSNFRPALRLLRRCRLQAL